MATAAHSYDPYATPTKRMTESDLLRAAAYFGVDVEGLEMESLRAAVKRSGEARWIEENREAMLEWSAWHEKNGHPLADLLR